MEAVCVKCGEYKDSAWIKCTSCDFSPNTEEERAKLLLLSTHFNNERNLRKFSQHIKNGSEVDFKEKDLEVVMQVLKTKKKSSKEHRKYILTLTGSFLLTIIFMVIFYYYQVNRR